MKTRIPEKLFTGLAALAMVASIAAPSLRAATVLWDVAATPTDYATPSQVSQTGDFVDAFTFNSSAVTVNGTTFNPYSSGAVAGGTATFTGSSNMTVSIAATAQSVFMASGGYGSTATPYGNLNYYSLTDYSNDYPGFRGIVGQVNLTGLTIGRTYYFQLWSGTYGNGDKMDFSSSSSIDGSGNFTTNVSPVLYTLDGVNVGGVVYPGQNIMGTFTADGTSQAIYYQNGGTGGSGWVNLGAGQLRVDPVPEPQTWALVLGGFGLLFGLQRRRAKASGEALTA